MRAGSSPFWLGGGTLEGPPQLPGPRIARNDSTVDWLSQSCLMKATTWGTKSQRTKEKRVPQEGRLTLDVIGLTPTDSVDVGAAVPQTCEGEAGQQCSRERSKKTHLDLV